MTNNINIESKNTKTLIIVIAITLFGLYVFSYLREPSEFECMQLGSDDAVDICMDEYHPSDGKKYYWSNHLYNENR